MISDPLLGGCSMENKKLSVLESNETKTEWVAPVLETISILNETNIETGTGSDGTAQNAIVS